MINRNDILERVLSLKPVEKAELIDQLLSSIDKPEVEQAFLPVY